MGEPRNEEEKRPTQRIDSGPGRHLGGDRSNTTNRSDRTSLPASSKPGESPAGAAAGRTSLERGGSVPAIQKTDSTGSAGRPELQKDGAEPRDASSGDQDHHVTQPEGSEGDKWQQAKGSDDEQPTGGPAPREGDKWQQASGQVVTHPETGEGDKWNQAPQQVVNLPDVVITGDPDSPIGRWQKGIAKGAEEVGEGAAIFLMSAFGAAMGDTAGIIGLMKEQAGTLADQASDPVMAAILSMQVVNPFFHLFLNLGRAAEARADGDCPKQDATSFTRPRHSSRHVP